MLVDVPTHFIHITIMLSIHNPIMHCPELSDGFILFVLTLRIHPAGDVL